MATDSSVAPEYPRPDARVPNSWLRERYPASAALADCLVAHGYPVRVGLYGGIGFEGSAAAVDEYTIDLEGCQAELEASRAEGSRR